MISLSPQRLWLLITALALLASPVLAFGVSDGATRHAPWHPTVSVNELEYRIPADRGRDEIGWDALLRIGDDLHGIELDSEGDAVVDGPDSVGTDTELLYSRKLGAHWRAKAGLEYVNSWTEDEYSDLWSGVLKLGWTELPSVSLTHTLYLSENGDALFEIEADHQLNIRKRLSLESGIDWVLAGQDVPERGLASGTTETEIDFLLVYDHRHSFAPYLGLRYIGALGGTRDIIQAAGDDPDQLFLLLGTRISF